MGPHPKKPRLHDRRREPKIMDRGGSAYTECTLQWISAGAKAALFNVPNRVNGEPTVYIPYSMMDNPEVLAPDKLGKDNLVRLRIQTWLCIKHHLVEE